MFSDPFAHYQRSRTPPIQPAATAASNDVMRMFEARRLAGRRPSAQALRAPEPPPLIESPITSEKPRSGAGRGQIHHPQRVVDVEPFPVHLVAVVATPATPGPAPFAVDAEAQRVLEQIASMHPEALAGVTVAKGVTISNGPVFLTASRTALSSSSSAQRSTAAANIRGAAAMLGAA